VKEVGGGGKGNLPPLNAVLSAECTNKEVEFLPTFAGKMKVSLWGGGGYYVGEGTGGPGRQST